MPRLLIVLLSILPALIVSGKDVTAIEVVGANDVRTCLRHVSPVRSNEVSFCGEESDTSVAEQVKRRKATSVQYYLYDHAGRLTRAEAKLENTGVDYTQEMEYDLNANGNMTQDRHSAITSISYNVLNLPAEVLYEGLLENRPVSQMVYDASGRKHIVRNGVKKLGAFTGDVTRYVGDYIIVNDTVDRLQTPYGYLRDGEFHSYVFDYQGNVMVVVSGDKVDQTNLYYADGLPMNVSTDATANRFKYSAKELSLFRGLPVYDYTARHTLPQLSNTFRTMDRECESFFHLSPYSYCGGDPINFIDPTGNRIVAYDDDGSEWEFRMVDGEYGFYNSDDQIYVRGNNFIGQLDNALQKIVSGDVGKIIVDGLIEMDQTLTIEGAENIDAGNEYYNNLNLVVWNPANENGGISINEQGNYSSSRPAFIGLAHELAHGYDQNILGGTDRKVWAQDKNELVRRSDIFAGNMENFIRLEHGIAPRIAYTNNVRSFNMATTRYNLPNSMSIKPTKDNISLWKY